MPHSIKLLNSLGLSLAIFQTADVQTDQFFLAKTNFLGGVRMEFYMNLQTLVITNFFYTTHTITVRDLGDKPCQPTWLLL